MSKLVGVFLEIANETERWDADGEDIVECLEWINHPDYEHIETSSDEVGESCYAIFKWKGKFYRVNYSYQSHYGINYYGDGSDVYEVHPKKVEVTKYV